MKEAFKLDKKRKALTIILGITIDIAAPVLFSEPTWSKDRGLIEESTGIIRMKLHLHPINNLLFLCCALCFPIQAKTLAGNIIKITDGDTATILTENQQQERIRLAGIDAPEKDQPFGKKSKQLLSRLVFGKTVTIEHNKHDRWGRIVGIIYLDNQDI